jgi:hypothetical protein
VLCTTGTGATPPEQYNFFHPASTLDMAPIQDGSQVGPGPGGGHPSSSRHASLSGRARPLNRAGWQASLLQIT